MSTVHHANITGSPFWRNSEEVVPIEMLWQQNIFFTSFSYVRNNHAIISPIIEGRRIYSDSGTNLARPQQNDRFARFAVQLLLTI